MTYNPVSAYMDALRKSFDYRGKASRGEYGMFMVGIIGIIVVFFIAGIISEEINYRMGINRYELYGDFLWYWDYISMWIFNIFGLQLPAIAAMARRFNDIGWPPWLGFVFVIPVIGWLFAIIFVFIPRRK